MLRRSAKAYRTALRSRAPRTVLPSQRHHLHSSTPLPVPTRASTVFPASTSPSDSPLLQVFDSPDSSTPSRSSPLSPSGLFLQPSLHLPSDFPPLARQTTLRAQVIVARICRPRPAPLDVADAERQFLGMVKALDRLSDLLCGVIDLAEVVRNVHPVEEWGEGANEAYEELCAFMNELNTHVGLYEALKSLHSVLPASTPTKSPELFAAFAVAVPFLRDFEKSGIHLPASQRHQFVSLSSDILQLGRRFLQNAGSPRAPVTVHASEIASAMGEPAARRFLHGRAVGEVDPHSWEGRVLARQHPSEDVRRRLTVAAQAAPEEHVEVLDDLLRTRARLAQLVGRESWGAVALEDKMAKTPENVLGFLDSLNKHTRPLARADLALLEHAKRQDVGRLGSATIHAWDRDYYSDRVGAGAGAGGLPDLSPFFSVGSCFLGLSRLFTALYGIRFEVEDTRAGEVWDQEVRKLRVVDEDEGVIGTIYCDLFARAGKQAGAAHYTVRCSRRVDDDDVAGDFDRDGIATLEDGGRVHRSEVSEGLIDAPEVRYNGREGVHQEPVIVLVCGFGLEGRASTDKAFLQWHEVETLFHEMGHAIHSMIGRTEYHNVSGTRCATDFVELPSILMEHFVASPAVLDLFAKHTQTGRTLPRDVLKDLMAERQRFSALETSSQIAMAALDQQLHSSLALSPSFSSSSLLPAVAAAYHVIPHAPGAAWQTQFGHLFGYGATYYSYLFDRSIAARVYGRLFRAEPLSREGGEVFKRGLLKWGGGRDPWEMVGGVVGSEAVARGAEEGMREVGRWGIESEEEGERGW